MPSAQDYINQAVSAGIPLSAIRNFLSGNPNDEHRIMSALGPDYLGGTSTTTVVPAPRAPYIPPPDPFFGNTGIVPPPSPYAPPASTVTPYATTNQPGGIFAASASDAALSGHAGLADNISRPQITINDDRTGQPASVMTVQGGPAIPSWVWLAVAALVLVLVMRK